MAQPGSFEIQNEFYYYGDQIMKTGFPFFILLLIFFYTGVAKMNNTDVALNSLISAEYAFAAKSEEKGIRQAFIFYLSDESIVFRPEPTNGKKWYTDRTETPGELNWYPVLADISESGDLGYTTGPWEYISENEKGESVSAFGHYVSVWQKQTDGQWKVNIDVGISHSKPEQTFTKLTVQNTYEKSNQTKYNADNESEKASLLKTENKFSKVSESEGFLTAFNKFSSTSVRLYRENLFPLAEKDQIDKTLSENVGILNWKPHDVKISVSADLGYTYGIAELRNKPNRAKSEPDEKRCYMRIWKKDSDGQWKVVLDIENQIPASIDQ